MDSCKGPEGGTLEATSFAAASPTLGFADLAPAMAENMSSRWSSRPELEVSIFPLINLPDCVLSRDMRVSLLL